MTEHEAASPSDKRGKITENLVHFARILRKAGMPIGPASVVDAVEAVEISGLSSRDDLYWTFHAVFVRKREHKPLFDEAFRIYWKTHGLVEKMLAILSPVAPSGPREPEPPKAGQTRLSQAFEANKQRTATQAAPQLEVDARFTVSEREVLQKKDFAQMTAEEIAKARHALRMMTLPLDKVPTRRLVAASRGRVDPRRSLRASLRSGGDIIELRHRRRAQVHPPIVALCDISGSMSQYTRLLLHFLHALTEKRRVHTFLFGTRLTNITRALEMKDPDEALMACTSGVEDWSGGTRIAQSLHEFNRKWSRRVLSGGPIVLFISDGLERQEDGQLSTEMDRLHRSCRRVVWLNPLLRFEGFEAKARGIRALLPHVDDFRAVHSLDAVSDLCKALDGSTGFAKQSDPRLWLERSA
ncbi:VWA domain-containing protein [Pseudovibrio exalbescens]|uniref:vWA domain-containing protein n=1 Tax=Pseudovibrio exalbescens TaxID=197461 RepID=UPI0023657126|nr:VWA domain-containing protein [Pseudovibrio exalbescens]MDD7910502.1 VWA domain-containing protein [Pseudovibrio exalbescens]